MPVFWQYILTKTHGDADGVIHVGGYSRPAGNTRVLSEFQCISGEKTEFPCPGCRIRPQAKQKNSRRKT